MDVPLQSARAWVHDGVRQTGYVRAGSGRTVVLLGGPAPDGAEAAPYFAGLARSCRVIQPDAGTALTQLNTWLTGFLDALGVHQASLVAFNGQALPALQYALAEPDRIERLALLMPESERDSASELAGTLSERGQQFLLLSAHCAALTARCPEQSASLQALISFLA